MGLYPLTEIGEETILLSYWMVYDYRLVVISPSHIIFSRVIHKLHSRKYYQRSIS